MTQDDTVIIPSAEQQAHEWMVLLTAEEAREEDRRRFERWLAIDAEHQQAWRETEQLWNAGKQLNALGQKHLPRSQTQFAKSNKKPAPMIAGLAMAASIMMAVFLWLPNSDSNSEGIHYRSELAQTRLIHLPEGSVITLGANSAIELHLSQSERRVTLQKGEAFFDVAKDSSRPFVVTSQGTQVSVLGTRFNVNQLSERSKVSVQSGLVAVTHMTSQKQVELAPGERVISNLDGLTPVSHQDANKSGAWREGLRLYFDAPLSDVIADFNRYSQRPLELAHDGLEDMTITAVFPTDDINLMVHSLGDILPVTIQEEDNRILLSRRP